MSQPNQKMSVWSKSNSSGLSLKKETGCTLSGDCNLLRVATENLWNAFRCRKIFKACQRGPQSPSLVKSLSWKLCNATDSSPWANFPSPAAAATSNIQLPTTNIQHPTAESEADWAVIRRLLHRIGSCRVFFFTLIYFFFTWRSVCCKPN